MSSQTYHMAMYPWFALGHLTAFLRLANKLAMKGHRISFLIPITTKSKLEPFNLHPHLITFVPVDVPRVAGLPDGAETTSDVPFALSHLIMEAMDMTKDNIEVNLKNLKVDLVFFDFTYWLPGLARGLGIKSVFYSTISPLMHGYALSPERGKEMAEGNLDLTKPPVSLPDQSIKLHAHEARGFTARTVMKFGGDITFFDRISIGVRDCDALAYSTCREIEGQFCDYIETQIQKPVLLAGPALPVPPKSVTLEEKWSDWLGKFKEGSVIYCAFGSECILQKDQFQELIYGLELTGMPFFAAMKPPFGADSVEAAIPEELKERLQGRGVVHGEWVQQQLFLQHPSVGCFVTHCGWASLSEALVNQCQIVLLPHVGDQVVNARIMSCTLRVGVEVEKGEEDGLFSRDSVCKAVRAVMDEKSEIGGEVRANHDKLRGFLLKPDLDSQYIDSFNERLHNLLE